MKLDSASHIPLSIWSAFRWKLGLSPYFLKTRYVQSNALETVELTEDPCPQGPDCLNSQE